MSMDPSTALRLLLLYSHLLLCVFALQLVLSTDLRVLRQAVDGQGLAVVHRRVIRLLAGLWATGVLLILVDQAIDPTRSLLEPKLVAKLTCVVLLTVNGVLIGRWCLPRIAAGGSLGGWESAGVMVVGAVSTCSWLMAAFFGIARPLKTWPVQNTLGLYVAALAIAAAAGLALNAWRRSAPSPAPLQGDDAADAHMA
jgi:hypothetical protein